jgi:aryl-alcohol dehydrogenase-like predicted oxidoreductase
MGFVHAAGKVTPKADAVRVIRAALERGVTMLDTAECYVGDDGHGGLIYSEEYVGEAIREIPRDQVVIATKCGVKWANGASGDMVHDARPKAIRSALEGSLKRLGTDWIDLYYLHRVDPAVPVENSLMYASACRRCGVPFELHIFERGGHGLSTCQELTSRQESETVPDNTVWVPLAVRFILRHWQQN